MIRFSRIGMSSGKKQATLAKFFSSKKRNGDEPAKLEDLAKRPKLDKAIEQPSSLADTQDSVSKAVETELEVSPLTSLRPSKPVVKNDIANAPKIQPVAPKESKILYSAICNLFNEVEGTSSRLQIVKLCSDFLYSVLSKTQNDLVPITYLLINRLGPDYQPGLELGLGEGLLMRTISESCGKSLAQVKARYRELGDLGRIAQEARSVQPTMFKPKPLTTGEVFSNLQAIAKSQGKDSQLRKVQLIKKMLTACQGVEAKFLIRSLESKLRIGLAEKSVLIALSKAILMQEHDGKEPSSDLIDAAEEKIRDAFCQVPNYEIVIKTALEHGIMNLDKHCVLTPGIPLKPMLAKPSKSVSEVLDRFQGHRFTCEYKYDGERAQVHLLPDGTMHIYSRNGESMTERYPEIKIADFIADKDATHTLILDCEAVAWDKDRNTILPFQVLSTRKRKGVVAEDVKVRVCLFAFDILCYNDEPLINRSFAERREYLHRVLKPVPGELQFASEMTTVSLDEMQQYLDQSVKDSCEGLMVKSLDGEESQYEPSKRSRNWLKLKKDYLQGVGDSLDLCVLGAYYGRGKRTGTYGGFLLGCYNQDSGEFETCCKIGTGFSDEMLQKLYDELKPTEIATPKAFYVYSESAPPDVWFEPSMLFEVLTADLSLSPVYKAGSSSHDKGVSLRFPRFIRIRDDKNVEDATSSEQVIEFYESQPHMG
ncbi:LAME_0B07008g1_1 [Lachancea meyersii CBS 8951]|uniref:DNA ligase n=1 Tax=Lachancea meyersii CBS 8951 TaxID=1266667 RepID=A0A1G4IWF1_9SACH|nr:LAME_0B07008g1_1 [Lachancea meyersii CBS 8951]